jgi:ribosomal protein S27AE
MSSCEICGKALVVENRKACAGKCHAIRTNKRAEARRIRETQNNRAVDEQVYEYFYSLVKPAGEIKKRKCLRCGVMMNATPGHRICAHCEQTNSRVVDRRAVRV